MTELSASKFDEGGLAKCIMSVRQELTFLDTDGVGAVLAVVIRKDVSEVPAIHTYLGMRGVPERKAALSALKAAISAVSGAIDWSGMDVKEILAAFGVKPK